METVVNVNGLSHSVNGYKILDDLNFQVGEGELLVLTGSSGAGKTTLLSLLAGLLKPPLGSIEICGCKQGRNKAKHSRQIGLVTQEYSLFSSFTVRENLTALGMMKGIPSKELAPKIEESVESFKLGDITHEKCQWLSWGAKQRLALACAMLNKPKLLLADDILAKGDVASTQIILENLYRHLREGNACIWSTARLQEVYSLATGQPHRREMAFTGGGNDHVQGQSQGEIRFEKATFGFLQEGRLTVHDGQKFMDELFANGQGYGGQIAGGGG